MITTNCSVGTETNPQGCFPNQNPVYKLARVRRKREKKKIMFSWVLVVVRPNLAQKSHMTCPPSRPHIKQSVSDLVWSTTDLSFVKVTKPFKTLNIDLMDSLIK